MNAVRELRVSDQSGGDLLERWLADGYVRSYRTAFLILHRHQDAEEAVQDAFLRAWRFRDAIPPGAATQRWMYRVVVDACSSKLRAERTARQRSQSLDCAEMDEIHTSVIAALSQLPEHLRVVVVLRFYSGLSEKEIAGVIRRRPGTVKSRIHEAKLLLARSSELEQHRAQPASTSTGAAR